MVTLRQVLDYFENSREGISLDSLARELGLPEGQLESMLDFWVRKGRLRLSIHDSDQCGGCGSSGHCPFDRVMPISYELTRDQNGPHPTSLESCPCN